MEPHADAKFKRESQGHSDKCGTQHKSVQMTGEKQSQMDRPPRPARLPQARLAQTGRSCRPARVRPDCGRHSPSLGPRLHVTPDSPQSPQQAPAESAPPPESCSDSGTPSALFALPLGVLSAPKLTARSPASCGHRTSRFVRQHFHIHCLQGPREQAGGMGTVFPLDTRGSERTSGWSEVTQLETREAEPEV